MNDKSEKLFFYACTASAVLMLLLLASYFFRGVPHAPLILSICIILFEITVPIEILKHLHISAKDCNIYAHNVDNMVDLVFPPFLRMRARPDFLGIKRELKSFFVVTLLIFSIYIFGYWIYFNLSTMTQGAKLVVNFNLPPRLFFEIITQIFVIALPEEVFYRGFLQSAMLKKWPNRTHLLGLPLGKAIILTNLIFALGHVQSTMNPARLLTFFPGLIFSYFVYKNKSLLAAVLFHAACNILGQILYASLYAAHID